MEEEKERNHEEENSYLVGTFLVCIPTALSTPSSSTTTATSGNEGQRALE